MPNKKQKDLLRTAFDLVDAVVELYLKTAIKPFLQFHEKFYAGMNTFLRKLLDDNNVPTWFTANFITYARTAAVLPCIVMLSRGRVLIPAITVLLVDFGDFLDGVVARYWVDEKKKEVNEKKKKKNNSGDSSRETSRSASPTSDADSFEVVTTGSPRALLSWVRLHRNRTYGGFIDAVCDKAFVIPCWITLLSSVTTSRHFILFQYMTLLCLTLAETASGCIRFQAYFTSGGVAAPAVQGFDFSTSAVKADHIGKAKQTFEMVGTALFILPLTRYIGLLLLLLAVPLAYESVRRKVISRVIYVCQDSSTSFDHKMLKFWMQASALGSKLIVGIPSAGKVTDMVLNACATSCVDQVIAEAPAKVDLMFLEKRGIDFVLMAPGQVKFVTDEVVNAKLVLAVGDDAVARPVEAKVEGKKE